VLHPLLAPLVLLAVVPDMWASARAAKLSYQSYVRLVSRMLRMQVASELLRTGPPPPSCGPARPASALLGEYRRSARSSPTRTAAGGVQDPGSPAGAGNCRRGQRPGLWGAGGLLYGGRCAALAGAAVVAMRLASSSLSTTIVGINQLCENILISTVTRTSLAQTTERTREPGGPGRGRRIRPRSR